MGVVKLSELKNQEPEMGPFVLSWWFVKKIELKPIKIHEIQR